MVLLWSEHVSESLSRVQLFPTPQTVAHQAPLSMEFSRLKYGVGSHSLLQGIFLIQGSNPSLLHGRQILYCQSHQGSPRTLEWVVCPFSSQSCRPRNQTGVSCMAGGFFIITHIIIKYILVVYWLRL